MKMPILLSGRLNQDGNKNTPMIGGIVIHPIFGKGQK